MYKLRKHWFALHIRHFTKQLPGCLGEKTFNVYILERFLSISCEQHGKNSGKRFLFQLFLSVLRYICGFMAVIAEAAFGICASAEPHHPSHVPSTAAQASRIQQK